MNSKQKEIQQVFLDSEKEVLKKLSGNYKDALDEINNRILMLNTREDADMQHVIYQVEYQKALKTQVESILDQLQANNFVTVSEYLAKAYEDGFIGTMYDLQNQGIPLVFPIDQEQVVAAIQHETKLSESLYTALGKDTKVLSKQIAGEISRGISNASMYSEMARNISGYAGISKNKAMRIARTEAHRIQCKATSDAQWKAKEKGADIVKQWDASLDGKTRDTHRELDGQIRELDEPFEVAGMKAMEPGGFGIAEEDINCRCALLQRARWALGGEYTKWDPEAPVLISDDGTTQFTVLKEKDYETFKDKYLKAIEETEKQYGIKYGEIAKDVDFDMIKSEEYKNKYSLITDNKDVNNELYKIAVKMLEHNTGTDHEDIYLLDAKLGTVLGKVTDSPISSGIVYTEAFKQAIEDSKENGIETIGMHNHPQGTPPSADDFRKAYENGYAYGIIPGHNGQLYKFETPSEPISKELADAVALDIGVLVEGGVDIDRACQLIYNEYGWTYQILEGGES